MGDTAPALLRQRREMLRLCEFIGAEFLWQQVRGIMGTAVAMVNGWLLERLYADYD